MIIKNFCFATKIPIALSAKKTWLVAISGGADSLCLTLLANDFAKQNGIKIIACFVDHKLRKESSTEILPIIDILKNFNIDHTVLTWHHQKDITGNTQNKARNARYSLLYSYCEKIQCQAILTGHHALDQWETFFMRLSRGSALRGLSCIANLSYKKEIMLCRPLLDFTPSDIKETLQKEYGISKYVNDPSNEKTQYERVRWRKAYQTLAHNHNLDIENINKSINRLQNANTCLNDIAAKAKLKMFNNGYLDIEKFSSLQLELKIRVVQNIIIQLTQKEIVSYGLVEKVSKEICKSNFKATNICGLIFKQTKSKNIEILREKRNVERKFET